MITKSASDMCNEQKNLLRLCNERNVPMNVITKKMGLPFSSMTTLHVTPFDDDTVNKIADFFQISPEELRSPVDDISVLGKNTVALLKTRRIAHKLGISDREVLYATGVDLRHVYSPQLKIERLQRVAGFLYIPLDYILGTIPEEEVDSILSERYAECNMKEKIAAFQSANPDATQKQCALELKCSQSTISRFWQQPKTIEEKMYKYAQKIRRHYGFDEDFAGEDFKNLFNSVALKDTQACLIQAYFYEGLTLKEIAAERGVSHQHAEQQLNKLFYKAIKILIDNKAAQDGSNYLAMSTGRPRLRKHSIIIPTEPARPVGRPTKQLALWE